LTAAVVVRPVETGADLERFIAFPYRLHRGDPLWVPPLRMDIRTMLSTSLNGIVSQQLVRRADNKGRVAAVEVMVNTTATANVIREGRPEQLTSIIQSGGLVGMQSLDTALRRLLDANLITGDEAYLKARHKADFEHLREEELPL